jgi:uncharacterized protein YlxP (DUF503 family)
MAVFIGTLRFRLRLPESGSLKEKRHVVKSVSARLQNEFRVAAAEVGDLGRWQIAEIAVACIGNDTRHVEEVIARAQDFVERNWPELEILDLETETLQAF